MKKLLVLTLVLGIASLASAGIDLGDIDGISYSVDTVGNTITISGAAVTGYGLNMVADDGSTLGTNAIPGGFSTANAGAFYATYGLLGVGASVGTGAAVDGVVYTLDFTPGATEISFFYSSLAGGSQFNIGGQAVNVEDYSMTIPEPMTMGLLGLGGLLLARRKK